MNGLALLPRHLNQQGTAYRADDVILESQDHRLTCATSLGELHDVSSSSWEPFIHVPEHLPRRNLPFVGSLV